MAKRKLKVNLTPVIRKLEVVTKGLVTTKMVGGYKSVFKGTGLEFEGYRDYQPIDDASFIDWKSSTRANKLLIKEFVEERNLNAFFLVDASQSMIFGSTEKLKNEYAAELVASLSYAMLAGNDSVGIALFNEDIIFSITPSRERNRFYAISKALVNPNYYGGKKDFVKALKFVINLLPRDSILFIISDFFGLKGDWKKYLRIASQKFDTIAVMVRDPRDYILTNEKTDVIVQDPFSDKQLLINPALINEEYKKYALTRKLELKNEFLKINVGCMDITTDKSFVPAITNFFARRRRRY